jgi:hypothetical protein
VFNQKLILPEEVKWNTINANHIIEATCGGHEVSILLNMPIHKPEQRSYNLVDFMKNEMLYYSCFLYH